MMTMGDGSVDASESSLLVAMTSSSGSGNRKSFECTYEGCGKTFSTSSNLTQHALIHTDERPHVCDLCGRAFRQSGNLSKHKKSHENAHLRWDRSTSSKPFKCQEPGCEKSFTANNSLQNHMRKHTGEQPFACPYDQCGERFTLKTGLQTHVKVHEALMGQRAQCLHSACRKTFRNEAELRAHIYACCPGLVQECSLLRTHLSALVQELERERHSQEGQPSTLESAMVRARALLELLPDSYEDDAGEALTADAEADDTETVARRVAGAWRLHREAAAEVASTATTKQAGMESGISTLIRAAGEDLEAAVVGHDKDVTVAAPTPMLITLMPLDLTGTKRTFQETFTERFFRTEGVGVGPGSSTDDRATSYI